VIWSFADRETELLFTDGRPSRRLPPNIQAVAVRKLQMLNAASSLMALKSPPGNRLEALRGDRAGQHSIRINDQWRICFTWKDSDAHQVAIVDYH
jgi:proteic killer suppression protein